AAVKYSIDRYLDPKTGFPARSYLASLSGVRVVDDHTVDVVTRYPDGLLMNRLAALVLVVAPRYYSTHDAARLASHPVGTGPFVFSRWDKGRSLTMKANPRYWDRGLPEVPRLVFRFIPPERQVRALLAGKVDLVTDVPGTQTTRVEASRRARILKRPVLFTISASFNLAKAPLSDPRFRKALNYAVDKEDLIRYDLMGNGIPSAGIVLKGHHGFEAAPGLDPYAYDLRKARRLMAEAGVKPGLTLRVLDIKADRAARIIAADWRRLGIKAEVHPTDDAHMIADMRRTPAWDLMIGSCPDPMYHPYFIPYIFLYSSSPFSLTRSTTVDGMLDAVARATDPGEQRRRVAAFSEAVNHEALTLFTYQRIRTYGLAKDLVFEPYLSGMPLFRETHFAPRGTR
ncbi:MAG: ABC transporter substrate-binding protein, partial [Elusimicrobia bacterium]|nr:ABC transporter substrate-binding protein [Elusimicrobiota bacterium]